MPQDAAVPPPAAETPTAVKHARLRRVALVVGGVLGAYLAWEVLTTFVAYTDDAYVRSDIVAVSPEVTGHIIQVDVQDNQAIHRGDLLVLIDPVPFKLAVDAQEAALREARAQSAADRDAIAAAQDQIRITTAELEYAQATQKRVVALTTDQFASRQQSDAANEALRRAQGSVDAAHAALDKAEQMLARDDATIQRVQAELAIAEWRLTRTKMFAPVDGTINNLTVRVGDTAKVDTPLIGIVDAHAWRIMANYKQDYIRGFRVGGTAWVWLDSHPWHIYRARIQGIARGISRSPDPLGLVPYVAPTTDWIRLQRRFPVTLVLDDPRADLPLYMGADARTVIFP
jgi:multidrug efflux system membrane fusion protein